MKLKVGDELTVTSRNLVAKANAKDFLVHRVQFVDELKKVENPRVVGVGIVAASGDDKAVIEREVVVLREVSLHHLVEVPLLPLLRQHSAEDAVTASVHLHQVLRILAAHQQRIPLLSDLTHLRDRYRERERIWMLFFLLVASSNGDIHHPNSSLFLKASAIEIAHILTFYYHTTLSSLLFFFLLTNHTNLLSSNYAIIHLYLLFQFSSQYFKTIITLHSTTIFTFISLKNKLLLQILLVVIS